ncbi:MAG: hypothetical protein WCT77_12975 [Bacteroidota bacterium]
MKKYIITIVLLIFTIACKDTDKEKLYEIANDIILHPEKVLDLKSNYPKYYNDEYISSNMKDSIKINKIYRYIENLFQKKSEIYKVIFKPMEKFIYMEYYYNQISKDKRNSVDMYYVEVWENSRDAYQIIIIKDGNKYYFYSVDELHTAEM